MGRGSLCSVRECGIGGYGCDCLGADMCKIDKCNSWEPVDGRRAFAVGQIDVPCTMTAQGSCLSKVDHVESLPEYKMVQVGSIQSDATLFNMRYQVDGAGEMLNKYKSGKTMYDSWVDKDLLKNRQFNVRLYQSPNSAFDSKLRSGADTVKYVCMITNDY